MPEAFASASDRSPSAEGANVLWGTVFNVANACAAFGLSPVGAERAVAGVGDATAKAADVDPPDAEVRVMSPANPTLNDEITKTAANAKATHSLA